MKKWRMSRMLLTLALSFSMIAAGCSNQSSAPAPKETATTENKGSGGEAKGDAKTEKKYAQGVTDTTITVGTWGPQTGPAATYGLVGNGMDAYFKYINEQGGINGRTLEFKFYDDGYQPAKAVAAAKRLVEEDEVFAIVGTIGTPSNLATRDYLVEKGVPVVSFASGASIFTTPVVKTWFAVLPNYRAEGKLLTKYAVETLGKKKIGVLYQNDDFGKDNLAGVEDYMKENGMEIAAKEAYSPADVDYAPAALKMKEAGVDAIILCTIPKPAAAFAKEVRKLGVDAQLIANTVTGSDPTVMTKLAEGAWEGVVTGGFGPKPTDDTPEMKTFRENWKKHYPKENEYSAFALSGWIYAEILVEAIRRSGDELTWENLVAQLETFDNWSGDFAHNITHTPENHIGTAAMYFMEVKNGENVKITENLPLFD
jgi:branched-chain amino acid transport system substrate-binding protein